ncbi:MAG: hypothetical protein L6R35_003281 [Caloplaca aegaea]|nr:MAG: hypothetical protein L6R35_003281 [Caloplaca aegaea]
MKMRFLARAWRRDQQLRSDEVAVKRISLSEQSSLAKAPHEIGSVISEHQHEISHGSSSIHIGTECDDDPNEHKKFWAVTEQADFKQAARLATGIRTDNAKLSGSSALRRLEKLRFSCKILMSPLHGSYNILFPVRFRDREQWLLKIPANGALNTWDEQSARALTSEVMTMKLIYNNSSIPVPRVYGFNATTDNPVRCPYILMDRIDGINLFHGWFYNQTSIGQDRFRERIITNVAKTMVQFNAFTFPKAGALQYDPTAKAFDVGPYRKVDNFRKGVGEANCYVQQGPFDDPRDYFLCSLDRHDTSKLVHTRQSQCKLLRVLIEWFFQATSTTEDLSGFVLTHPDFDLQNLITGKDGSLRGMVDWDGVAAVPRCLGCEEYPLWLSSDWDPSYWNYDPELECVLREPAMLPAELDHYRALYQQSVDDALTNGCSHDVSSTVQVHGEIQQGGGRRSSRTRVSCLARSLYIAANEPKALPYNVDMILEKIINLSSDTHLDNDNNSAISQADSGVDVGGPVQEASLLRTEDKSTLIKVVTGLSDNPPSTEADNGNPICALQINQLFSPSSSDCFSPPYKDDQDSIPIQYETGLIDDGSLKAVRRDCSTDDCKNRYTTSEGWNKDIFMFIRVMTAPLIWTPAILVLLMQWVHSWNTFPIVIFFAALLFSGFDLAAELSIMLGLSLLFVSSSSNDRAHRNRKTTISNCESVPRTIDNHYVPSGWEPPVPVKLLDENAQDDEHVESQKDVQDTSPLQTFPAPCKKHLTPLHTLEISDVCPDRVEQPRQDESDSSDKSSRKSGATNITVPSLSSNPDRELEARIQRRIQEHKNGELMMLPFEERLERIKQIWKEDPTHDFGLFTSSNIYNALHQGSLDAARLRRLRIGFQRLLASLDERFVNFDGLR